MEVWIEILTSVINVLRTPSLPLWKCGLKSGNAKGKKKYVVTSLVEVWIEITSMSSSFAICTLVTSLVEVWIEIDSAGSLLDSSVVTSLVEVWIEILVKKCVKITKVVTSLVEVWIEIYTGGS